MTDHPTIPSWAVPGARVVCIRTHMPDLDVAPLVMNEVYVIRHVFEATDGSREKILVHLRGVVNGLATISGREVGYWLSRFRPAVAQKTEQEDVALFERIAHGTTIVERLDLLKEKLDA